MHWWHVILELQCVCVCVCALFYWISSVCVCFTCLWCRSRLQLDVCSCCRLSSFLRSLRWPHRSPSCQSEAEVAATETELHLLLWSSNFPPPPPCNNRGGCHTHIHWHVSCSLLLVTASCCVFVSAVFFKGERGREVRREGLLHSNRLWQFLGWHGAADRSCWAVIRVKLIRSPYGKGRPEGSEEESRLLFKHQLSHSDESYSQYWSSHSFSCYFLSNLVISVSSSGHRLLLFTAFFSFSICIFMSSSKCKCGLCNVHFDF